MPFALPIVNQPLIRTLIPSATLNRTGPGGAATSARAGMPLHGSPSRDGTRGSPLRSHRVHISPGKRADQRRNGARTSSRNAAIAPSGHRPFASRTPSGGESCIRVRALLRNGPPVVPQRGWPCPGVDRFSTCRCRVARARAHGDPRARHPAGPPGERFMVAGVTVEATGGRHAPIYGEQRTAPTSATSSTSGCTIRSRPLGPSTSRGRSAPQQGTGFGTSQGISLVGTSWPTSRERSTRVRIRSTPPWRPSHRCGPRSTG